MPETLSLAGDAGVGNHGSEMGYHVAMATAGNSVPLPVHNSLDRSTNQYVRWEVAMLRGKEKLGMEKKKQQQHLMGDSSALRKAVECPSWRCSV